MSPLTTLASPPTSMSAPDLSPPLTPMTPRWWQSLWSRRDGRLHGIRQFMLTQLAAVEDGAVRIRLAEQIEAATYPQALWALRDPLRMALVEAHGELLARQRMTDVSFMFAGLLQLEREGSRPPISQEKLPGWSDAKAARAAAVAPTEH